MSKHSDKFEFSAKENEQIDATIKVSSEKNSVINGLVVNFKNEPIKNAVVKLFEKVKTRNDIKLIPITHTFTDSFGNFLFGPLCPNKKYVLKVWFDDVVIRKVHFCGNNDDSDCLKGELHEDNSSNNCSCNNHEHYSCHNSECEDHPSEYDEYDEPNCNSSKSL